MHGLEFLMWDSIFSTRPSHVARLIQTRGSIILMIWSVCGCRTRHVERWLRHHVKFRASHLEPFGNDREAQDIINCDAGIRPGQLEALLVQFQFEIWANQLARFDACFGPKPTPALTHSLSLSSFLTL